MKQSCSCILHNNILFVTSLEVKKNVIDFNIMFIFSSYFLPDMVPIRKITMAVR